MRRHEVRPDPLTGRDPARRAGQGRDARDGRPDPRCRAEPGAPCDVTCSRCGSPPGRRALLVSGLLAARAGDQPSTSRPESLRTSVREGQPGAARLCPGTPSPTLAGTRRTARKRAKPPPEAMSHSCRIEV